LKPARAMNGFSRAPAPPIGKAIVMLGAGSGCSGRLPGRQRTRLLERRARLKAMALTLGRSREFGVWPGVVKECQEGALGPGELGAVLAHRDHMRDVALASVDAPGPCLRAPGR